MTGHYQKGFLLPLALLAAAFSGVPAQAQTLSGSPSPITFPNCTVGSGTLSQSLSLTTSAGTIAFQGQARTDDDRGWLSISPLNGTAPTTVTVSINTNSLTPGTHTGSAQFGYLGTKQLNVPVSFSCAVPAPNLTGLSPSQVATGTTFTMTVSGSSFLPGMTIFVNNQSVATNVVNSGSATAVIPGSLIATSGNYTVTARNTVEGQSSAVSNALGFGAVGPSFQIQVSSLFPFTHTVGAAAPASKTFSYVTTDGSSHATTLSASTNNGGNWLSVQGTGSTPGTATVSVNPTNLAAGNYSGAISVAVSGATNSPQTVGVALTVSAATNITLSVGSPTLSFSIPQGAAAQTAQVSVTSSSGNLAFQASVSGSGLSVSPNSGTTPGSVTVTANPTGLAVGAQNGSLSITAAGASNSPINVPITFQVTAPQGPPLTITSGAPPPGIVGNPYSFSFTASGGTAPYSWSVAGSVPPGLSLSPSGALAGTPTTVGTFPFTVQVADSAGASATTSVSVTITAVAPPQLLLSSQSISLPATVNGTASSQTISYTLSNSASAPISAAPSTQSGGGWLSVQLSSGSTPGSATISANPAGLSAGTFAGSVTFTATPPGGSVSAVVSVTLTVTGGSQTSALNVSPPSVSLAAAVGAAPRTATLNVTSSGSPLIFNATASGGNWLAVSQSGSTTPANLTVTATPGNLAAGTYNGSITIASQDASNSPVTVNVTFTLSTGTGPATLSAQPAQIAFNVALGSASTSQTVALTSSGAQVSFSASSIISQWLSVSPSSGTTPATLTVTVNPATLGLGVHSGAIVVSAPGATNPSLSLNVQVTVATQVRPVISLIQQGGSFAPVIAPNTWIVIKGSNLAGTTRVNRPDEIVNGAYPTSMDGVRVSVNGRPAFLYYISPTQLNVAAPDDTALGSVPVTVTVGGQTSEVATAQMQRFAPGFFQWPENQVVATNIAFELRVRPGTFEGLQTVSAEPGEVVVLWGTGFGPTNPPTPAGQVVVNTGFVVSPVRVTVGGIEAEYFGAAMTPTFTALCQVAIRIPANAPDGDLPVVATVGGLSSAADTVINVRRR